MTLLFIKLFSDKDFFILMLLLYTFIFLFTLLVSLGFTIYLFRKYQNMTTRSKIGWGIVQWITAYFLGCLTMLPVFAYEAFVLHGKGDEIWLLYMFLAALSFVFAHYITIKKIMKKLQASKNPVYE